MSVRSLLFVAIVLTAAIAAPAQAVVIVFEKVPKGEEQPVQKVEIRKVEKKFEGSLPSYEVVVSFKKDTTPQDAAFTADMVRERVTSALGSRFAQTNRPIRVNCDGSKAMAEVGSMLVESNERDLYEVLGGELLNFLEMDLSAAVPSLRFEEKPTDKELKAATKIIAELLGKNNKHRKVKVEFTIGIIET